MERIEAWVVGGGERRVEIERGNGKRYRVTLSITQGGNRITASSLGETIEAAAVDALDAWLRYTT